MASELIGLWKEICAPPLNISHVASCKESLSDPLPPLHFSPAAERHVRSFVYLWNFTHLRPKVSKITLHCVHASTTAWALGKSKTKKKMVYESEMYPNQGVNLHQYKETIY